MHRTDGWPRRTGGAGRSHPTRTGNVGSVTDSPQHPPVRPPDADTTPEPLELVAIERDLAAVEAALPRLDDGSYWVDETTGDPIPDAVLAADPVARRA